MHHHVLENQRVVVIVHSFNASFHSLGEFRNVSCKDYLSEDNVKGEDLEEEV